MGACQTEPLSQKPSRQAVTVASGVNAPLVTPPPLDTPITPLPTCAPEEVAARFAAMSSYTPTEGNFVYLEDNHLMLEEWRYITRGVNYYPSAYPFWKFLQVDQDTLFQDFAIISELGLNTLRIFIWYEPLFTCSGNGAVPIAAQFERLDAIIQTAAQFNLKLIVVLHDQPELTTYSLYDNLPIALAQTQYLVARYQNEPTILAWDIRDSGDTDYQGGMIGGIPKVATVERIVVLDWLIRMASAIRAVDSHHLITAGWSADAAATAVAVDFVSFQQWQPEDTVATLVGEIRQNSDKPLLLIAFGYEIHAQDDTNQAAILRDTLQLIEQGMRADELLGWMIWTAFDFAEGSACDVMACDTPQDGRHYYGLWRVDRTAKTAAEVVRSFTQPWQDLVPAQITETVP